MSNDDYDGQGKTGASHKHPLLHLLAEPDYPECFERNPISIA